MCLLLSMVCTWIHGDSLVFLLLQVPSLAVGGAADTADSSGSIAALSMHLLCALSLLRCLLMHMGFGKGTCGKFFCGTIYHLQWLYSGCILSKSVGLKQDYIVCMRVL